jgi:hypothetical protein
MNDKSLCKCGHAKEQHKVDGVCIYEYSICGCFIFKYI